MYHKGPGVKKSGPKGRNKAKGKVLDVMLEELEKDPSASSEIISRRITSRTGVPISSRTVRRVRNERGKTRSLKQSRREASARTSPPTFS